VFSLVETLGGMTVGEFLQRTSSREIAEWMAYNQIKIEDRQREEMERRCMQNLEARKAR